MWTVLQPLAGAFVAFKGFLCSFPGAQEGKDYGAYFALQQICFSLTQHSRRTFHWTVSVVSLGGI